MTGEPFTFRAPWYERERGGHTLVDDRAKRPVIQKYDSTRFVEQVTTDPLDSLKFDVEDLFTYPVPVKFPAPGTGRERLATSRLVRSKLRKLYQPNHDRFYVVVAELFCDVPGLPRAGSHRDIEVNFVLRRNQATFTGSPSELRTLSRKLLESLTDSQLKNIPLATDLAAGTPDVDDLWWANTVYEQLARDHADLIEAVGVKIEEQGWLVDAKTGSGRWDKLSAQSETLREQVYPMFRIPDTAAKCDKARTRSMWFGLVPTYSAEHWKESIGDRDRLVPKLDERAIYHIRTLVTQKRPPGQEHCPPKQWWSEPTEPFRLAAPYDPEGTKNRKVSISAPDFRALAARATKPPGPGGLTINTPPGSQMKFSPFNIPKSGDGSFADGGICTFAFELFFIIALFLFLMFLPIVVFAFQLWWLLALRFCFPRLDASMTILADYFVGVNVITDLLKSNDPHKKAKAAFQDVLGTETADLLIEQAGKGKFPNDAASAQALVAAIDPNNAAGPSTGEKLPEVPDPLCEKG